MTFKEEEKHVLTKRYNYTWYFIEDIPIVKYPLIKSDPGWTVPADDVLIISAK